MSQQAVDAGFNAVQQRRDGAVVWSKREHRYLIFWLTVHPNGVAELTWELALGEYFVEKGFTFSAQDELSLFVFPTTEITGTMDDGWLQRSMDQVTDRLRGIDLARGV
ncbi:MAG TPA: hypothetical protein VM840_01430 [Actinomycetota bacterium]|nr:hypothetical protein [Actinomycetota bacterium]